MATDKKNPTQEVVTLRADKKTVQSWRRAASKVGNTLSGWLRHLATEAAKVKP
jgi:hypothetical protein